MLENVWTDDFEQANVMNDDEPPMAKSVKQFIWLSSGLVIL